MNRLTHWINGYQGSEFFNISFFSRMGAIAGLLGVVLGLVEGLGLATSVPAIERLLPALSNLAVIFWLIGIYASQSPRLGRLGSFGLGSASAGLMGIIIFNLIQQAAKTSSGNWAGVILASPAIPLVFTAIAVLFVWGILALGTKSLQAGLLPRGAVVFWMVGMMASLNSSWIPVKIAVIAGILWTSFVLLRDIPAKNAGRLPGVTTVDRTTRAANETGRLIPLDALRGAIMILMAIDHASLFIRHWHPFETWDQPLPDYPSLAALLTRLVTHPCAPGFFFLMGVGMILFAHSRRRIGWSEGRIAGHLALRGLLFIALEKLIVDVASSGKINPLGFSILAGLGAAMLIGILFLRLNGIVQAVIGMAILLLMQVLPGLLLHADLGIFNAIRLLLLPGSEGSVSVLYAPIPWLGVVLLGMAFARLLQRNKDRAFQVAGVVGLVCLALFPIVRALGGFGNLRMPVGNTLVDFFNLVKYPPSLSFLLLSLGFDLVVLYLFFRFSSKLAAWGRPLVILGQAALFFFLAHWFIYAAMGGIQGGLRQTYLGWVVGLILLYPVCKAFESFKHSMQVNSVWRML